ncbi:MAG TPA: hypothetical protein VFM04_01960 [Candidatus Methylomirabilis sp.]|nr:hypothetical protein [Candidatus Methylomirabilis sp.]
MGEKLVGRTKHGELTLDQLASIQPGMARLMEEVAHRYSLMHYACTGGNWELGHHELKELRGLFRIAATTRPKYAAELAAFDREYLTPIDSAIAKKDLEAFTLAAQKGIAGSDEVHRRLGYAFIRYRLPKRPPDHLDLGPGSEP